MRQTQERRLRLPEAGWRSRPQHQGWSSLSVRFPASGKNSSVWHGADAHCAQLRSIVTITSFHALASVDSQFGYLDPVWTPTLSDECCTIAGIGESHAPLLDHNVSANGNRAPAPASGRWRTRTGPVGSFSERRNYDTEPSIIQSFDCSLSATRRAISADASSGIGKTELTLISPST